MLVGDLELQALNYWVRTRGISTLGTCEISFIAFNCMEAFQFHLACTNKICDALRDLVAFVQFKKREKHPWRSINFSKVSGFS